MDRIKPTQNNDGKFEASNLELIDSGPDLCIKLVNNL